MQTFPLLGKFLEEAISISQGQYSPFGLSQKHGGKNILNNVKERLRDFIKFDLFALFKPLLQF